MRITAGFGYNCNLQVDLDKELAAYKKAYDLVKQDNQKMMLEVNDAKLQVDQEKKEKEMVSCLFCLLLPANTF